MSEKKATFYDFKLDSDGDDHLCIELPYEYARLYFNALSVYLMDCEDRDRIYPMSMNGTLIKEELTEEERLDDEE